MKRKPTPSYLSHSASDRARAVWTDTTGTRDQKLLTGSFNSTESRTAFAELQLEIETSPLRSPGAVGAESVSINELMLAYLKHTEQHYRNPDGNGTSELREYKLVVRHVRERCGHMPATDFDPLAIKAVRQTFIGAGWRRGVVNQRIGRVRRIFKWAVAEELIPPTVYQALAAVAGFQQGRTPAQFPFRFPPFPSSKPSRAFSGRWTTRSS